MRNRNRLRIFLLTLSLAFLGVVAISSLLLKPEKCEVENIVPQKQIHSEFNYEKDKIYGIDVSHYQSLIDWQYLAQNENITFVYVRATMGSEGRDELTAQNVEQATENGFLVGLYHFFYLDEDVTTQFQNFENVYSSMETSLNPVLDVEPKKVKKRGRWREQKPPKGLCDSVAKFIDLFHEKHPNSDMVLYSAQTFFNNFLLKRFPMSIKWIANYSREPEMKNDLFYHIWQFTDSGNLCGIKARVDMNVLVRQDALSILKKRKEPNLQLQP